MSQRVESAADRLKGLDPLAAIAAWLSRDFAHDEERFLIAAIRRVLGLELSDVEIKDVLYDSEDTESDALETLRRLLVADRGRADANQSGVKPR